MEDMNEYVDVDIIENGKVIGTFKCRHITEEKTEKTNEEKKKELEKQDIRLNKLCFDYQEKEKQIEELKDQLDKAIDLLRMCQNTYLRDPELKIEVEQFLRGIEI